MQVNSTIIYLLVILLNKFGWGFYRVFERDWRNCEILRIIMDERTSARFVSIRIGS